MAVAMVSMHAQGLTVSHPLSRFHCIFHLNLALIVDILGNITIGDESCDRGNSLISKFHIAFNSTSQSHVVHLINLLRSCLYSDDRCDSNLFDVFSLI